MPSSHRAGRGDRRERAQAIRQGDERLLKEAYGDLQGGLKRIVELKEKAREQAGRKLIRCGTTWQTVRPRTGAVPMRCRRPVPEPPCENGVGARFTNGPVRDPHGHCPSSVAVAAVTPRAARRASGRRTASRDTRATPQAEGLVRAWGQVCIHTPAPAPLGVALGPMIPGGKAVQPMGTLGLGRQVIGGCAPAASSMCPPDPARDPGLPNPRLGAAYSPLDPQTSR